MSLEPLDALSRLAARRFASFADASGSVLDLLASAAPDGCLILCQADWEAFECKVLEARGGAVERGATLPLARGGSGELVDPEALAALWPEILASAPLDSSDGTVVGALLGPPRLAGLLLVSARLLSYEWESISTRAELRRLAEAARDRDSTDPVTGLPTREALLDAVDREWELSRRGTVESYVVACHLADRGEMAERHGSALADLILKDVSEAFAAGVRRTDHLARVDEDALAVVLVGCKGPDGARAFLTRVERSVERAAAARPVSAGLAYGIQELAGSGSAAEALELSLLAARAGELSAPLAAAAAEEAV